MQFSPGADGNSRLRIAAASPQDIVNSKCTSWTYWDLTSVQFGIPAVKDTTGPVDYPDMSLGDNSLYLSVDARGGGNGLLVVRVPLNEIQAGGTINFRFTTPSDSASAYGGHLCQNTGDELFWGGCGAPKNNGTLQVCSWAENSNTYFWRDVALSYNWPNGTISSFAKDGTTDCSISLPAHASIPFTFSSGGIPWSTPGKSLSSRPARGNCTKKQIGQMLCVCPICFLYCNAAPLLQGRLKSPARAVIIYIYLILIFTVAFVPMISARSTLSISLILTGINWVTLVYVPEVVKLVAEPASFVEVTVLTFST